MTSSLLSHTRRSIPLLTPIRKVWAATKARLGQRLANTQNPAERYSQREFIQEIMARNPDAFQSDWDVEAFMQYCPNS